MQPLTLTHSHVGTALDKHWKKFSKAPKLAWARTILSFVGAYIALTAETHDLRMYVGVVLALNVVAEFFYELYRWLGVDNPDDLLEEEVQAELDQRPLAKPGI